MKNKQPSRLRRWLKRGAFTLAVLITLVAAVVVFENWRGHRAWQQYRAEQEAKGEVFDWRQLVPPPVPDEQNFAQTPLLAKLMDYKYDPQTQQPVFADPEAKARIDGLFAWKDPLRGEGSWRKTTPTDWRTIQDSLRALTNSTLPAVQALLARPVGKPEDDVLFLLAENETELDEMIAAAQRPHSDFLVHYEEGTLALLPQLAVIKNFTYALRLRALARLESNSTDDALADWQICMRLGDALRGDPLLISLLVRLAIYDMSSQVVWEGLAKRQWSGGQLQDIEARLNDLNLVAEALVALRGERAFNMMALDQWHLREMTGFPDRLPGEGHGSRIFPSGRVSQNKLAIARMYELFIFGAFDAERRIVDVALANQYEREAGQTLSQSHPYTTMAARLFPAIHLASLKVSNGQIALNLARVGCALERHRLAHGSYPAALNALVPAYLEAIPLDLDRQPLRYRLQPNGSFILYSIGIDLQDDHGRIGKPNGTFTTEEGDWVWKYPEAADR